MIFLKNKKVLNFIFVISCLLNIAICYFINITSQETFNLFDTHNIIICIVFVLIVIAYILCQIAIKTRSPKSHNKRLQKAFQDNGGYEAVVNEMKTCIENHDYKSFRELKKMVDVIEK